MAGLDITGYEYALSTSPDNNNNYSSYGSYLAASWSSGTTFTITGLTNGTYYKIKLRAVNSLGKGQESAVIGPFLPRTTPGLPVFSSSSSGNGTYTLNWTAPVDTGGAPVISYTVELTTANQAAWSGTTVTGITGLTHQFTGLTNGASYRARVLAVTAGGSGSYKDPYPSGQETPSTTPGAPTYRDASATDKTYTLKWNAPADNGGAAVTYTVQVTDANQQNWSTSVSGVTATEYTFTGLTNGASYRAQVRADNVRGSSGYFDNGAQTARTPSFAAPGISASANYASSTVGERGNRRIDWAVDPTDISASSAGAGTTTYVYLQWMVSDNTWSSANAAEELVATYSGNQYVTGSGNIFTNSQYVTAGEQYRIRAVQYDGSHGVSSGWVNIQVIATQTGYYNDWAYTNGVNVYTTGNFTVNGSSYFNVSGSTIPGVNTANVGDTQYEITVLKVTATGSSSSSASSSTRNFTVKYSGPNTANASTNSMPNVHNTSSASNGWSGAGNTSMLYDFNVSNIGYGYAGRGYVAVDGGGSATTWSPTIVVSIEARGNRRTMTTYSYTY